ncbi:MAG TPA: DEAD/DEAH box helicase [Candidatus Sulfotelmatobacter sp.]|jgi:hypothetical protein|nr:DEAD/DEAH box helicase [Candidatus Sulfotelmatobacter sp.]
MLKSSISAAATQSLFDSASNAADKGQAQWFTPLDWARILSVPLNPYRPVIADLMCGNGQLLRGAKPLRPVELISQPKTKTALLGCDLDASGFNSANAVSADLTRFYAKLRAVDWKCDTFVLNPGWDLHLYREPMAALLESECPAVREAFEAHDGRTPRECIDSTIATLCIALDRSSHLTDILLVSNNATLERLLFGGNAPHRALAAHAWAHLIIPGNICVDKLSDFQTGVVWLARSHTRGLTAGSMKLVARTPAERLAAVETAVADISRDRYKLRNGPETATYLQTANSVELWKAAQEEQELENGGRAQASFNIWFDNQAGVIRTYLNTFDTASGRVDKVAAASLHALNDRQPIQLVVQRNTRRALENAVGIGGRPQGPWTVDPALMHAVETAIAEYNHVRAPLYPLPEIQRLGYLDEQDDILCTRSVSSGRTGTVFRKGRRYALRSTTVAVKRLGTKMNTIGTLDDVEWNGQELAFFITDDNGAERCFMEERLRAKNVKINLIKPGTTGRKAKDIEEDVECVIDFTLQKLVDSFVIPKVPDVATINPKLFQSYLKTLSDIEKFLVTFKFKQFQRDDYARAAMQDGVILGHDTGLGKTIALFMWALLKCGYVAEGNKLRPAKPVLLIVPGDGHDQTDDEARKHFKTKTVRLESQETFYKLAKPDPRTGRWSLPPAYYLTSYQQLTGNGVVDFPPLSRLHPESTMSQLYLKEADAVDWWNRRGQIYTRDYERLKVTANSTLKEIEDAYENIRRTSDNIVIDLAYESVCVLRWLTPTGGAGAGLRDAAKPSAPSTKRFNAAAKVEAPVPARGSGHAWERLDEQQQQFIRSELVICRHRDYSSGIGETRTLPPKEGQPEGQPEVRVRVKCVYSPSLADLGQDCFSACIIDEGTKIKGDDTIIGTGVRQINADYRLVLTATPIKNRFPDVFHLAHYVCGGHEEPTARFPYGKVDKQTFAEEFLVSERNLSKEENSEDKRRFVKFTPQVCNVHRAWKLLAPVILRRRKEDCGEAIVPKIRHVVRVPMGLYQAATYQFHLKAKYRDCKGRPAVGAKLQALRIAAANPASELLIRPEHDDSDGNPRSKFTYIPKVASSLELVRLAMERREQVIIGSAFQNGLDVFSARLNEAGVKHLVLDGRVNQKRRGELARLFKLGCPRAVDEGLIERASDYPVLLAGQECMAELHNFHLCNNILLTAYSWAFDKFEQFINRAHRMNSPWDVNVWSVICDGSIDRKLEGGIHEKKDAAGLVLDGHLLGETPGEVNFAELLHIAELEFKTVKTIDEHDLEQGWPRLRAALGRAFLQWKGIIPSSAKPQAVANDLPLWRQRLSRRRR